MLDDPSQNVKLSEMLIIKSEMPNFVIEKWSIQSFKTVNGHYQFNYSNLFTNLSLFPQI